MFFAVTPGAAVQEKITKTAEKLPVLAGMRPVLPEDLHVTLLFMSMVAARERRCLERDMRQISVPPFTLRLDGYGYFERAQAIWLGCSSRPHELDALVDCLKSLAERCGVGFDDRAFTPHVTLFRKAGGRVAFPDVPVAIEWRAKEFHLLGSLPHEKTTRYKTKYNKIATWRLAGESKN